MYVFLKDGKPTDKAGYATVLDANITELMSHTHARLNVGRCGVSTPIESILDFKADYSAAVDTIYTYVPDEWHHAHSFPKLTSMCKNKEEYITNPPNARLLSKESVEWVKNNCRKESDVQIIIRYD